MRRILSLVLALALLAGAMPALAQDAAEREIVNQLKLLVERFLESNDYNYTNDGDSYTVEFYLDSSLGSSTVYMTVDYDSVQVLAYADIVASKANRDKMAILTTLLNWELFYTQFTMDYESGRFASRALQYVESTLPGMEEMDVIFHMALTNLDDYGDTLAQVALMGRDPFEAFEEAMANR